MGKNSYFCVDFHHITWGQPVGQFSVFAHPDFKRGGFSVLYTNIVRSVSQVYGLVLNRPSVSLLSVSGWFSSFSTRLVTNTTGFNKERLL